MECGVGRHDGNGNGSRALWRFDIISIAAAACCCLLTPVSYLLHAACCLLLAAVFLPGERASNPESNSEMLKHALACGAHLTLQAVHLGGDARDHAMEGAAEIPMNQTERAEVSQELPRRMAAMKESIHRFDPVEQTERAEGGDGSKA
jgi:hypothetical protein